MSQSDHNPDARYKSLLQSLREMDAAVVAFSGGLDSTFLLHAARQALQDNVLAVTLATPYMSKAEIEEAKCAARAMGARHEIIELPFPESIRTNPADRCYLCKHSLFSHLMEMARKKGIGHVLDGTNLDDLGDYRPGLKALRELGVESPLLAAGLSKQDLRTLARAHGLDVWDKPAAACLLTRIPHDTRVDEDELRRIEQAELFLKDIGFSAVRLRSHDDIARIEVPPEQVAEVVRANAEHGIDKRLKELGYRHVTVDLAGYRMGSLNKNGT
ncbi:ATP-dependent sacrificial sulfur transferase LarE [Oceanidesulfovibrio marinus]|uniref:ATP-dependent sacrificial sulfur transferase LarE n=1 Tax=Oceanidesulfovibrio marinus TaxID=370038 RepID=A0ABX6NDR5_9BACT|nr:ATP-dependent sacrificial sulfur transferase LarE [Oceanidesulfovibrio marinus]QJT08732.1 ATP-dependent sacrificial sulfur transferase LarE [Oceanidesulfovibrio marinus]